MKSPSARVLLMLIIFGSLISGAPLCDQASGQVEDIRAARSADSPFGTSSGSMMSLLNENVIKRDLELTPDQSNQIREMKLKHDELVHQIMEEYRQVARDTKPEERRDYYNDLREKRKQNNEELEKHIADILLPFQTERLEQIKVQFQMKSVNRRSASPILHPLFREKLGIDDKQEKRLKKKMSEVKKRLDEEIAVLRRKASEEILDELTEEQRKTYDEIIGEPLENSSRKDD